MAAAIGTKERPLLLPIGIIPFGHHRFSGLVFDHRTEEFVIIQITWNQGRSMEQKKGALQSYCRRPALGRWAPARGRFYQSYRGQQRKLVVWQRRSPVRELLMQTVTAQSLADASRNETGWTPA